VRKIAWGPLQLSRVQPEAGLIVIVVALTVVQSTFSFQVIVTLLFRATPVAPSAGTVVLTEGPDRSTVTVIPAPAASTLLDESVALL
jgi:hypothetical protein